MARNLHAAKKAKYDEFYTQLADIENEVSHYKAHFKGKVVYCNCDDPRASQFFHFFSHNFEHLGLKKLITTCYKNRNRDLFSRHDDERAIKLEYDGFREGDSIPNANDIGVTKLEGDGDFRSQECIDILKQADIVVTNPPFSLFREYVAQLVEHKKRFLIIGNKNAIKYKEVFPFIQSNEIWIGHTPMSKDLLFDVTAEYAAELVKTKKEGSGYKIIDGKVKGRSQSIWFTNLDHDKRHEELILHQNYTPEAYPTYDNYDAIDIGKTSMIPMDWGGQWVFPSPSWTSTTRTSLKSWAFLTFGMTA